jgi:2'-5' RNA ligase
MPTHTHRLFFALCPPPSTVPEVERAAEAVKTAGVIRGSWLATDKYHLTLHFLGDHPALPGDLLERAKAAAVMVRSAPFQFALDNVSSFRGKWQSPCVLRCARETDVALRAFFRDLGDALTAQGLGHYVERRFTPHVTLAYGNNALTEPIAVTPIIWPVSDFVLIDSHFGKSHHEVLETWRLSG